MTRPLRLAAYPRLSPAMRGTVVDGLSAAIDTVAARAAPSHRFLRYQWFAAATRAYGGSPRTIVVTDADVPVLALPFVGFGPRWAKLVAVPGCYWPFRSVPIAQGAGEAAAAALAVLARMANGLRIGPAIDGDPAVTALVDAARARGWGVVGKVAGGSALLDIDGDWPRGSTLRKNRFHEKHLAAHGALDWRMLGPGTDWGSAFADMAAVEARSWIATETDGRDAKFAGTPHAAFWHAAVADPVLAAMVAGALLHVDGRPAAFAFDLDAGDRRYAVANGYDAGFAKHSPGKLLQYRNLAAAKARGIRMVDWGMGDSGYKAVMGAVEGPHLRNWLLLRPGLPATIGRALARIQTRT